MNAGRGANGSKQTREGAAAGFIRNAQHTLPEGF
jgi:hypothetical protein